MRVTLRTVVVPLLVWSGSLPASVAEELSCPPPVRTQPPTGKPVVHADGLLWKLEREGTPPSYLV